MLFVAVDDARNKVDIEARARVICNKRVWRSIIRRACQDAHLDARHRLTSAKRFLQGDDR